MQKGYKEVETIIRKLVLSYDKGRKYLYILTLSKVLKLQLKCLVMNDIAIFIVLQFKANEFTCYEESIYK